MNAARRWASQLEAWALPKDLLASAEEDPYSWPVELWERRRELAEQEPPPPTFEVIRRFLPGSVLDVGAGTGRSCLVFAREGNRVVAVEKNPQMAQALARAADGLDVEVVVGSWPDVADRVGEVDVAASSHVVYDVRDLVSFLAAMHRKAQRAVVLELTERHPWSDLAPYYMALHGLERPDGPDVDDLVAVVRENLGVDPEVRRWTRPSAMWYRDWDELLAYMGRRLVLPRGRWDELRRLLAEEVIEEEGRLRTRKPEQAMATVWWETDG
jgi:SAM-dependent methyltransferase